MSHTFTAKQQFWSEKLKDAEQSGQSLAEYARTHNLSAQKLYQWRSTLRNITTSVTQQTQFTRLVTTTASVNTELLVHLPNAQLKFPTLPDAAWLKQLLAQPET